MTPHSRIVSIALLTAVAACSNGGSGVGDSTVEQRSFATRFLRAAEREGWVLDLLAPAPDGVARDIDGDGAVDLVLGGAGDEARIVWGPIAAGRPETSTIDIGVPAAAVAVLDVDGDLDLDLILPAPDGLGLTVWDQVAPRDFQRRLVVPGIGFDGLRDVIVTDLLANGVPDVVTVGRELRRLLVGDGAGGFFDVSAQLPGDTREMRRVAAGRLFGSARSDLVFVGPQGVAVLRNDGAGFTDVTLGTVGSPAQVADDVAIGDVDADGDDDLLLRSSGNVTWWASDGAGGVASAQTLPAPGTGSMQLGDADGDGDLELAVATGASVAVFDFDGAAMRFVPLPPGSITGARASDDVLAFTDLDGDGRGDVLASGDSPWVAWRLGDGTFAGDPARNGRSFVDAGAAASSGRRIVGDFDGDLDPDLVTGSVGANGAVALRLSRNDGAGNFRDQVIALGQPGSDPQFVPAAALDVDRDGDLDLLGDGWAAGDGNGSFAAAVAWPGGASGVPVVGDFDGDGRSEVVVPDGLQLVRFTPSAAGPVRDVPPGPVLSSQPSRLVVGDVDGDRIDDLLVVHRDNGLSLFTGSANGFVDASVKLPGGFGAVGHAALGDWDGDGDVDLIATSAGSATALVARLLRNDGDRFVVAAELRAATPVLEVLAVAAADVDEDGRAEVFVHGRVGAGVGGAARVDVFEASATDGGVRRVPPEFAGVDGLAPLAGVFAPQFVDLDGDRDPDAIGLEVRSNGLREIAFRTRPELGASTTIRVLDRTGGGAAVVFLGVAPIYAPIGDLGFALLEPSLALVEIAPFPADPGFVDVTFQLPPLPVASLRLFAQALRLDAGNNVRALTTRAEALAR